MSIPHGSRDGDSDRSSRHLSKRANLIHREFLQLALLIGLAVVAFFLTRAIAASNREMSLRDGLEWYRRGERQLEQGDIDDAIDSFRRATVRNRNEKRYVLALARALTSKRQDEAATSTLLALRESSPEDPEINLQLARVTAEREDVTEALRYYHSTLYAPWPADQATARRSVRLELIDFLLTHDQMNRALSELLALSNDLPDAPDLHVQVGERFAKAGDSRHALEQFQKALQLAPQNGAALTGAGIAAFQLRDFAAAGKYLHAAPPGGVDGATARDVADLVLTNDPLASRIGRDERRRRLGDNLAYSMQRFNACLEQQSGGPARPNDAALGQEAQGFDARFHSAEGRDDDIIETGVDLIARLETAASAACPPVTPRDHALVLIAQLHGVDQH